MPVWIDWSLSITIAAGMGRNPVWRYEFPLNEIISLIELTTPLRSDFTIPGLFLRMTIRFRIL
jgi:hypothetical protein